MSDSEVINGLARIFGSSGRLDLSGKQLTNISALKTLKGDTINHLSLESNQISDISILSEIEWECPVLMLGNNKIKDISVLAKIPDLYALSLSDNLITDISALEKMCSLEGLDLSGNQITDLGPLVNLAKSGWGNLEHDLDLSDNPDLNEAEIEKLQIAFGKKEEESWEGSSVWFPFSHNAGPKENARRISSRK